MIVGSACGSMAFNNNFLGTVHACAHQLSSVADLPHGLANAMMLGTGNAVEYVKQYGSISDIAQAMGANIHVLSLREAAEKAVELVEALSNDGYSQTLIRGWRDHGYD